MVSLLFEFGSFDFKRKETKPMDQKLFNKILLIILIIETIFLAGVLGYRLGEVKALETQQPIYNITLQVDPSMIEYKEVDNPEPEEAEESVAEPVEPTLATYIEPSYTEEEIEYIAKTIWGEARGANKTEQSAVVWCILNRVDSSLDYMPDDIISVITQKSQFTGYKSSNPVTQEHYDLAKDVLNRWDREKAGEIDVGRTLPKDYLWFVADGTGFSNVFSNKWKGGTKWDWSIESPYI